MQKFYIIFILAVYSIFAFYLIGCGENEEDAAFISAYPPNNSTIDSDEVITVLFDNTPVTLDVEIQGQQDTSFLWELDGRTLTVRGNSTFRFGKKYIIIITWATGRKILNYTVRPSPPPKVIVVADATFVRATPASGDLAANRSITVKFDNNPGDVTVSVGTVAGSGKSRTITGPFPVGALTLTIKWENGEGSHTLNYTVVKVD